MDFRDLGLEQRGMAQRSVAKTGSSPGTRQREGTKQTQSSRVAGCYSALARKDMLTQAAACRKLEDII